MKITKITSDKLGSNTYIVETDEGIIVIDPSVSIELITDVAKKAKKKIQYALITHGHFDHCCTAAALQKQGVKILMSAEDYSMFEKGYDLSRFFCGNFQKFMPDMFISEGKYNLIGLEVEVIETPGHTKGGLCFVIGNELFSGDTIFEMAVGRSDLPTGNSDQLGNSIKKLFDLRKNYRILPGHGENTTIDKERKGNPYVSEL